MSLMTWPNVISLLRLPLAGAFAANESRPVRVAIALAAGFSDFIDGWLARSRGWNSRSGELLDPLTDRVFVSTALMSFVESGELQPAELGVLLCRDVYTAGAFVGATALNLPIRPRSRMSGKVVTALQVATIVTLLIRPKWAKALVVGAGIAGAWSIIDYTRAGLADLRAAGDPREAPGEQQ